MKPLDSRFPKGECLDVEFQLLPVVRGIVVITVMMLSSGTAFAAEDMDSANYRMPYCRQLAANIGHPADAPGRGSCLREINTVILADSRICIPPSSTAEQTVMIVVHYIDERPMQRHESFKKLARDALQAAWPCKK